VITELGVTIPLGIRYFVFFPKQFTRYANSFKFFLQMGQTLFEILELGHDRPDYLNAADLPAPDPPQPKVGHVQLCLTYLKEIGLYGILTYTETADIALMA
jgi:hypothetical protein